LQEQDNNYLELYRSSDGFSDLEYIRVIPYIKRVFKTKLSESWSKDESMEYKIQ
jgi:hypothetical protein